MYGTVPNYNSLRVFGCACFVLLQPHERTKLEPRARLCCFLGYGIEHKGYRCWDPSSKRLRISRHVIFWEHKMFSSLSPFHLSPHSSPPYFTDSSIDLFPDDVDTASPEFHATIPLEVPVSPADPAPVDAPASFPTSTNQSLRWSTRVRNIPTHLRDYHCFSAILSHHEPHSYREANSNPLW